MSVVNTYIKEKKIVKGETQLEVVQKVMQAGVHWKMVGDIKYFPQSFPYTYQALLQKVHVKKDN